MSESRSDNASLEAQLEKAGRMRWLKSVDALLKAGANPNTGAEDPHYGMPGTPVYTPLYHAVLSEYLEIAERLLEAGANPNTGKYGGRWTLNPLGMAVRKSHRSMVRLLADAGV